MITTCVHARTFTGPGTRINWRPANLPCDPKDPENNPAIILHESNEQDRYYAAASLERERLQKLGQYQRRKRN